MQIDYTKGAQVIYSPEQADKWGYGFGEWIMNDNAAETTTAVASPGLFGSFPWVDNKKGYCAMLFTFNLNNKHRGELYRNLKAVVDETMK